MQGGSRPGSSRALPEVDEVLAVGGGDRFRIVRRLGAGGMGVVYEAHDAERGHNVALKTLRDRTADQLYRLKREFRALADLSHPNLVTLYDLFIDGERCFFTMELVRGTDFFTYCRGGPGVAPSPTSRPTVAATPPAKEVEAITGDDTGAAAEPEIVITELACDEGRLRNALRQLALGLSALHTAGKIHRDIKPSNVLVTDDGRVVLLDFGLVTDSSRDDGGSLIGHLVGTVEYMSPEQVGADVALTSASDWYGVGTMAYEAMTGRLPFVGPHMEILLAKVKRSPPPPRAIVPSVPRDLDELCVELLSRDPRRRPPGKEILDRLGVSPEDARSAAHTYSTGSTSREHRTPFSGRTAELARLDDAMARVDAGHTAVVVISGPSGIGKSELLEESLRRAGRDSRALVLRGRCYQQETVPYKAIDPIVDDLSRTWLALPEAEARTLVPRWSMLLPRLFPVLGRVPAVAEARGRIQLVDPQEVRTRAFAALREVFHRLAERYRVVVTIDDTQWIDGDTLTLLSDLLRPPDAPPLMLILCWRTEHERVSDSSTSASLFSRTLPPPPDATPEPDDNGIGLLELLRSLETDVDHIALGPLDDAAATLVATDLLGDAGDLAASVVREARGNPFFLTELIHYVLAEDVVDIGSVRLDDVLGDRIARNTDAAQRLLRVLATASEPLTLRVAREAAGLDNDTLARELRVLRVGHLVRAAGSRGEDRVELYHDRIRTAVRGMVGRRQMQELHRALVLALERWNDGSTQRLARHWHGAGESSRAAEYALAAATEAVDKLDFQRGAALYDLALRLEDYPPDEARAIQARMAEAHVNAGQPQKAAAAFMAATATAPAGQALELRRRAAGELLRGGYMSEGFEAIRSVLVQMGLRMARTPAQALIGLLGRRLWLRLRGLHARLRDESQVAPRALTEADVYWSVGTGLSVVDPIFGAHYQSKYLSLSLRLGEPRRLTRALGLEASHLATQVNGARTRKLIERARDLLDPDDVFGQAYLTLSEGFLHNFVLNDWAGSLALFEETHRLLAERSQGGLELDTAQFYECINLAYLGELAELRRRRSAYVRGADRRGSNYASVNMRARLSIVWLMQDDPSRAEEDLDEALSRWQTPRSSFQVPHFLAMIGRAEAALYRNAPDEADQIARAHRRDIKRALLLRVVRLHADLVFLQARIAVARAAAGDRAATREAEKLTRTLSRIRQPMVVPQVHQLRATLAHQRGDRETALAELRASVRGYEDLSMSAHARAAQRRLGQILGGNPGNEQIGRAIAWMRQEGVRNPPAFTDVFCPGWTSGDDAGD